MKEASLSPKNNPRLSRLRSFFEGKYYPLLTCALVLVGSLTGFEFYLNIINTSLIITALAVCDTVKPFIIGMVTYVYQIAVKHGPGYTSLDYGRPSDGGGSSYYFTSWRLPVLIILFTAFAAAIIYFIVKNKIYRRISPKKTPLFIPLAVFSAALILNGVFSGSWDVRSFLYGAGNAIVFFLLFLFVYHGFRSDERGEELARYFIYISALTATVIATELVALYLTSDNVFVNGSINKEAIALGWGIWNMIGVSAAVLVPTCFLGMVKNKLPWLYFAAANLAYIASLLSMSRNAQLFASVAYASCVLILCFKGRHRLPMRIIAAVGAALVIVFAIVFWDKIIALLKDNIDISNSGDASNGRFENWKLALGAFLSAPVFGAGFYGLANSLTTDLFGFLPRMAHNTLFELLGAMGIFGTGAYIYYRVMSVKPFFRRPSLTKTMLGISILVLLAESLLDNFVFNFYPLFYAQTALAIVYKIVDEENAELPRM